jgi:hypothetical protein
MEPFAEALGAFLRFSLKSDSLAAYLVFMIASGLVGSDIVLLDACSVSLGRDSYLDLTHGWRTTPKAALVWTMGAVLGSGIGLLARVFEPTPIAAVLVALTWRGLLGKLQRLSAHQDRMGAGE